MRPLTVITGILLGSSFSIAFSLAGVLLIFFILGDENPRLQHEFGPLFNSFAIFSAMTAICGMSFYALTKVHAGRFYWQAVMWLGIAAVALHYWP